MTADSSTVAEFIATHLAAKEIMWARSILQKMGHTQDSPTVLGEDNNMSTIAIKKMTVTEKRRSILLFDSTLSVSKYKI